MFRKGRSFSTFKCSLPLDPFLDIIAGSWSPLFNPLQLLFFRPGSRDSVISARCSGRKADKTPAGMSFGPWSRKDKCRMHCVKLYFSFIHLVISMHHLYILYVLFEVFIVICQCLWSLFIISIYIVSIRGIKIFLTWLDLPQGIRTISNDLISASWALGLVEAATCDGVN